MSQRINYFLIICFLEGASVMAVELVGAKLIAPWFGTSLYVWTSVLGVSMLGLATGYYFGGYWSRQHNNATTLKGLLALAALFIAIMPTSAEWILTMTQKMDVRWGSLIASLVFILPPLILMGMVSPLLIRYCTIASNMAGSISGKIFATSTVGGVTSVLLTGFYLLPIWGLYNTPWLFSGLMLSTVFIVMLANRASTATPPST